MTKAGCQLPETESSAPVAGRFAFNWDRRLAPAARLFGVSPHRAWAEINQGGLTVRFGPWSVQTPLSNVSRASVTGPYRWWRVAGPARLSMADGGLTFASSTGAGVCVDFKEPISGIDPWGLIRHPSLTVTVESPKSFCHALSPGGCASAHQGVPNPSIGSGESTARPNDAVSRVIRGVGAGLVATAAMSGPMVVARRLAGFGRTPPRVITEATLGPFAKATPSAAKLTTAAAHFGYGAGSGALFGWLAPRLPGPRLLRGVIFALLLLLVSYEGWVPASGMLPPLHRQSRLRMGSLLASHLVFGTVIGWLAT